MIQKWIRLQLKLFFKLNNLLSTNDFFMYENYHFDGYNSRHTKFI